MLDPQDVVHRQVAMIALELLRQGRPPDQGLAVHIRNLAELVRAGWDPQVARQVRGEQDERGHRHPLAGLEREQTTHPVTDDHRPRPETLQRRHDVLGVSVEGQVRRIRGS